LASDISHLNLVILITSLFLQAVLNGTSCARA
jgi:hypothetical protein